MEDNIYNRILCAQRNQKAMEELLTQFDPLIFWDFLNSLLTKHQAQIVMYIVAKGFSVNQVAKIYGVSPEAITLSKNRAYKKLRNYYISNH